MKRRRNRIPSRRPLATTAGTLAAIALGSACGVRGEAIMIPPLPPNPHLVQVPADRDGDLLCAAEERALGYDPNCVDQNASAIPDGQELAWICGAMIHRIPEADPNTNQLHKVSHALRGQEWCSACLESVNMGSLDIVHPQLNLSTQVPLMACHALSHGSFSFSGTTNQGRLQVDRSLRILALSDSFAGLKLEMDANDD